MKIPLVSVIVPCYNHEKYIEECIDSIVTQSYSNYELIVFDDGSKDSSPKIIEQLSIKYGFQCVLQSNKGLTPTINNALKNYAKGKYILFFASDDIMYPKRIERQIEFMEANPHYAMSYSNAKIINAKSEEIGEHKMAPISGWIFDDLFLAKFNIPAYTCIYRADLFKEVGYYDEQAMIEDSDIFYKIAKKYQIGYLDIFSAYYRRHGANMSLRFLDMYRDTVRRLNQYQLESNYNEAMFNAKKIFFFYLSFNNKVEAIKLFPTALRQPFNKFFLAGCLNLLGLKFITTKYIK